VGQFRWARIGSRLTGLLHGCDAGADEEREPSDHDTGDGVGELVADGEPGLYEEDEDGAYECGDEGGFVADLLEHVGSLDSSVKRIDKRIYRVHNGYMTKTEAAEILATAHECIAPCNHEDLCEHPAADTPPAWTPDDRGGA
jgi:hypothetical protein